MKGLILWAVGGAAAAAFCLLALSEAPSLSLSGQVSGLEEEEALVLISRNDCRGQQPRIVLAEGPVLPDGSFALETIPQGPGVSWLCVVSSTGRWTRHRFPARGPDSLSSRGTQSLRLTLPHGGDQP